MQEQVLEFVATRVEFEQAQDAGHPRPLALIYHDKLTGPSGEHLVLLYSRTEHRDQWTLYYGPSQLMVRSDLSVGCDWYSDTEVRMDITGDGCQVDCLYFDPSGDSLKLEDVPGIHGVEWRRVNPNEYKLETSDEGRTLKVAKR